MYITTTECVGRKECVKICPTDAIRLINGKSFSCITCGVCYDVCPNNAIFRNSYGGFVVDKAKCNGCGICEHSCPIDSIHIEDGIVKGICSMCGLCEDICEYRVDSLKIVEDNKTKFLNSLKETIPKISKSDIPTNNKVDNYAKRQCLDTDYEKCTLCGRCAYYCPTNAIDVKIEQDGICTECNICEDVCPVGAIENSKINNDKCTLCLNCVNNCPHHAINIEEFNLNINKTEDKITGSFVSCLNCGLCADNYDDSLKRKDNKLRYDPVKDNLNNHENIIEKCPVSILKESDNSKLKGYCVSCGKCYQVCQNNARKTKIIKWDGKIEDGCISCGICVELCPKNAITLKRSGINVNLDECIMCETCAINCPKDVIPKRTTVKNEILSGFNMIDDNLCVNCGMCESICPEDAIINKNNKFSVDEEKCIYCGACKNLCPANAFIFERKFKKVV